MSRDGCRIAPQCRGCPLPECRYVSGVVPERVVRNIQVLALARQGIPVTQIAADLNISARTVYRIVGGQQTR